MENQELYAAITTLLTVGVLLLNLGAEKVKTNLTEGLILIGVGAILIFGATIIFKLLINKVLEAKLHADK